MKLNELYINYEKNNIEGIFNHILSRFKQDKQAPYLEKSGIPKDDEFIELVNINYSSEYMNVLRRFNNPTKWDISFVDLKNAIKLTLRNVCLLGSGDYNKMAGISNFIGPPLHILIALVKEDKYKKHSLISKNLSHPKFVTLKLNQLSLMTPS